MQTLVKTLKREMGKQTLLLMSSSEEEQWLSSETCGTTADRQTLGWFNHHYWGAISDGIQERSYVLLKANKLKEIEWNDGMSCKKWWQHMACVLLRGEEKERRMWCSTSTSRVLRKMLLMPDQSLFIKPDSLSGRSPESLSQPQSSSLLSFI